MKNGSVLTKRVVISSAIVVSAAVAWMLIAGLILALATALPAWAVVVLSALLGAAGAAGATYLLVTYFVRETLRPVTVLRDAAVRIAGGSLDARASERAPGELGELGRAINNLSYQLSRNMYQLILERNRLIQMLDNLSEGIVAVDSEGKLTHQNPSIDALMGGGARITDPMLHRMDGGRIWADFKRAIETGAGTERNIEARGKIVRVVISPIIDEIGETAGAVGLFSDITQQERLERTRRDYVANVSHEMRTPLTAMRALIEPLKEGMVKTEDARMRYYDIILREVMRLSRLINDLMELSRLQSATLAIEKNRMHIGELMRDVCDRYAAIAAEHDLAFHVKGDFERLPEVYANPDRLEQMMVILLDNAMKYTEAGSITVSVDETPDQLIVHVSDTGVGISAEDLPHVFDRFYKVDKAHSGKGSGLGLSIARELWNWMGETLTVQSEKGVGSRFSFTITRKNPEEASA